MLLWCSFPSCWTLAQPLAVRKQDAVQIGFWKEGLCWVAEAAPSTHSMQCGCLCAASLCPRLCMGKRIWQGRHPLDSNIRRKGHWVKTGFYEEKGGYVSLDDFDTLWTKMWFLQLVRIFHVKPGFYQTGVCRRVQGLSKPASRLSPCHWWPFCILEWMQFAFLVSHLHHAMRIRYSRTFS